MDLKTELDLCIRSRFPLVCVVSHEEERILEQVQQLCETRKDSLFVWDHADYFQRLSGKDGDPLSARDPVTALEAIEGSEQAGIYLLRDYHQCWAGQPTVVRKLRNVVQHLKYTKKTIVVTMPVYEVPEELKDEVVVLDFPLPGRKELAQILKQLLSAPGARADADREVIEKIIRSALGLSSNQAQRIFAKAIVSEGVLDERDIALITAEKKQVIRESGALEYYTPQETLADVGGLEVLKSWLRLREEAFSEEAQQYGLPAPKGIALIGVPGTGKSLTARMVASLWQLPLIKMDVGALFGEFVGTSEHNLRRALRLAETVAPCVLWVDEIEKAFSVGAGDGGTSMRVFASMLSWMQEKTAPVFLVATANEIGLLPPELLRRGRFDEIFFLDLPTSSERREIFEVHIRKRGRDPAHFDLDGLARASESYVGAEIEQAVIDGLFLAYNDNKRELDTRDVVRSLARTVPMSRSQREIIEILREWLTEGRAQSASFKEAQQASRRFVPIEIDTSQSPKGKTS